VTVYSVMCNFEARGGGVASMYLCVAPALQCCIGQSAAYDACENKVEFLPCDAMRCTVLVIVILSVCLSVRPSVRPSVTLAHCVHMVQPTIMISSPYGSPIILVSGISSPSQNSKGVTPSEGVE